MTIFADASAMIAIIAAEDDALALADCLERDQHRLFSAISGWETVAGLHHAYRLTVAQAQSRTRLFLAELGFRMVAISDAEFALATEAYARFGKGRHPAALNMGDCYAYACTKSNNARLLFKGNDFVQTDIEPALTG